MYVIRGEGEWQMCMRRKIIRYLVAWTLFSYSAAPKRRPTQSPCSPTTPLSYQRSSLRPTSHQQHPSSSQAKSTQCTSNPAAPTIGGINGNEVESTRTYDTPSPYSLSRSPSPLGSLGGSQQPDLGTHRQMAVLEEKRNVISRNQYSPPDEPDSEPSSPAKLAHSSQPLSVGKESLAGQQRNRTRVMRRAPAGPSISVTDSDGTRVFLRVSSASQTEGKGKVSVACGCTVVYILVLKCVLIVVVHTCSCLSLLSSIKQSCIGLYHKHL